MNKQQAELNDQETRRKTLPRRIKIASQIIDRTKRESNEQASERSRTPRGKNSLSPNFCPNCLNKRGSCQY